MFALFVYLPLCLHNLSYKHGIFIEIMGIMFNFVANRAPFPILPDVMCSIFNSFVSATKWWLVEQRMLPAPCLFDSCPLCGLLHYSTPLVSLTKCFSVSTGRRNMSSTITTHETEGGVHEGSLCMWSLLLLPFSVDTFELQQALVCRHGG